MIEADLSTDDGPDSPPPHLADARYPHPDVAPAVALGVAMAVFTVVFARLVILRQNRFRTIDFDLGIHDQSIWLLSRLHDFSTVRGLPVLGHHATFAYVLLVPLAWLGGGPNLWNTLQVVALAATAIPLYRLARLRTSNAWLAVVPAGVWLLQPSVQSFAWETFHPEVMALPFLVWAYDAGERQNWRLFAGLLFVTVCWKEDLSLAVMGLGLLYLIRRRRRVGLYLLAGGLTWFIVIGSILVPHAAGGKTVYGGLYGDLGSTPSQVLVGGLRHPTRIVRKLQQNHASAYLRDILAPTGLSPVASPGALLIGAPQAFVNLLTYAEFTRDLHYHYQAVPLAATAMAMVEGIGVLYRGRRAWGRAAAGLALASGFAASMVWGIGPQSVRYRTGFWPLLPTLDQSAREQALRLIGPDDAVAADFFQVPHLTHRRVVYTFPNPWTNKNYGITDASHGDQAAVKWLAVDRSLMGGPETTLFNSLVSSGEFSIRFEDGTFVVAERTAPQP